ncbi:hypothetical protein DB30_01397 [Enhygromyxa salina]|uniref:Uncharacterized protein n=1 Tax=Enhygromyxa salina TaxID=215803 RepID=A0A0C2A4I8_9BACT|nr:hypothetical protein DB30_01397 [Enhygromyxa salina]
MAAAIVFSGVFTAACADAPITAGDLQADGQLRAQPADSQQSVHAASETNRPKAQVAERLQVTGLVAAQAEGALEDATRFALDSESIYLHLRADGLTQPRPVTFVWLHGDQRRETMGFLQPSETLSLAASLPLARFVVEGMTPPDPQVEQEPDPLALTGVWKVEVYGADPSGPNLVFEREFEILTVEAAEALAHS